MKAYRILLAAACGVVAFCVPTSAMARYAYCKTHAPHQSVRVTPVFEYPAGVGSDGIDPDFENYIEAKLGFDVFPNCTSYGDEAAARKWQAYALAQTDQDLPAILDEGFETYLAQKYGGGRKTRSSSTAGGGGAAEKTSSRALTEAVEERTPLVPKKSAAQIAAADAAARKAKYEAEFQARQDEYERQLADRERRIQEFNELTAKMEAEKKTNVAAAQAAIDAYKQEQEKYAETIRQHQDEIARYQAQVSASSSKPVGSGESGTRPAAFRRPAASSARARQRWNR